MAHYNWISLVLLCSFGLAWADNQELGTRVLVQPDGTRFSVREYVDEFGHYLWADAGYVIQDETTGYYYYARYDNTGKATPSALRVGRDDASSEVSQLDLENEQALEEMVWGSHGVGSFAGALGKASAITFPEELLVLLVEFSNVKHHPKYRVSDFEDMLFGNNYTRSPDNEDPDNEDASGSMRQYYEDMSGGDYTLKGRVVNQVRADDKNIPIWVTLGMDKSDYHSGTKPSFRNAVLAAAASKGISTTPSATRPLCIIYAGNRYQNGGGLHPHYAPGEYIYVVPERTTAPFDVEHDSAKFTPIGVHCHEFGHVLGLKDYYHGSQNYRQWGLMANGSHRGAYPSPLSPHLRAELGWLELTKVEGFKESQSLPSDQDVVYRIQSSSDLDDFSLSLLDDDFFLIENRQPDERWNKGLPGGLLIWHVKDEAGIRDDIDLIEADDSNDLYSTGGILFPARRGKEI